LLTRFPSGGLIEDNPASVAFPPKDAGVPVTVFGAKETTHTKINADLGLPDDPAPKALFEFLGKAFKK
jgi:hypothetical protein